MEIAPSTGAYSGTKFRKSLKKRLKKMRRKQAKKDPENTPQHNRYGKGGWAD